MKKLKSGIMILALLVITFSGVLFGCGDKYKNMKVSTDVADSTLTIYYYADKTPTEEELVEKPTEVTFKASISGAPSDCLLSLNYSFENANLVSVKKAESGSSTDFTLSALNGGSTKMKLITAEGGKSTTININVVCELTEMQYTASYTPYVLVGETTHLNTSTLITFLPSQTTQKRVKYVMQGQYEGVIVAEDGTVTVADTANNGTFDVMIESLDNEDIKLADPIQVSVLKPIDSITAKFGDEEVEDIILATNRDAQSYKKLDLTAEPNDNPYSFSFAWIYSDGTRHDILNNDYVELGIIGGDSSKIGLTAKTSGTVSLEITAKLDGYEYVSAPKLIKIVTEDMPVNVSINGQKSSTSSYVYDTYSNNLGYPVLVNVGETIAQDKRFVLTINDEAKDKVQILKADGEEVKLYSETETYDIFASGTTLYVKSIANSLSSVETENLATITAMAYRTLDLGNPVVKNSINCYLRTGVKAIGISKTSVDSGIYYYPIAESSADTQPVKITTEVGEYTSYITCQNTSDKVGINSQVDYNQAVIDGNRRVFTFQLYGIKEGTLELKFSAENGTTLLVQIRIYQVIDDVSITADSINTNSDIGQINYQTFAGTQSTLDSGSIVLKVGGKMQIYVNQFYKLNGDYISCSCTLKQVNCVITKEVISNGTTSVVPATSDEIFVSNTNGANTIFVNKQISDYTVTVTIQYYAEFDSEGNSITSGFATVTKTFKVSSYIAISNVKLDKQQITLYTLDSLPDYEDYLKNYGEHTFVLSVYPQIDEETDFAKQHITKTVTYSYNYYALTRKEQDESSMTVSFNRGLEFRDADSYTCTLSVVITQFGRTFLAEAKITVKNATRVSNLYNLKKDGQSLVKQDFILTSEDSLTTTNMTEYYVYQDARTISTSNGFELSCDINPANALITNLTYTVGGIDGTASKTNTNEMLQISATGKVTLTGVPGICIITISAVDSYVKETETFSILLKIYVKIADGASEATAIEISSASDLVSIASNQNSMNLFYKLTKNIDLSSTSWAPIGYFDNTAVEFAGSLDGEIYKDGYRQYATISGLTISNVSLVGGTINYGLFASIGESGIVKNLNLLIQSVKLDVAGKQLYYGAVCGILNGEILNVNVNYTSTDSKIAFNSQSYIGGLVGIANASSQIICSVCSGNLSITQNSKNDAGYIGGLVGQNNGTIDGQTDFYNNGNVLCGYNSAVDLTILDRSSSINDLNGASGGIAGKNTATIKNCSFAGSISSGSMVGGIVGNNTGTISSSYSSGRLKGTTLIGGLVGVSSSGTISASSVNMFDETTDSNTDYIPNITGTGYVGGLVGKISGGSLTGCYVRSYIQSNTENADTFLGDIKCTSTSDTYCGGLAGEASNITIEKCYSFQKISATSSVKVGGLVGSATAVVVSNCYERNTLKDYTNYGSIFAESDGTSTAQYFYSTNNASFSNYGTISDTSKCVKNDGIANLKNISTYSQWDITNTLSSTANWYLPDSGDYYPFLTSNGKVLTVEAPTNIIIGLATGDKVASRIKKIEPINDVDYYVLWKNNSNKTMWLKDVLTVTVMPTDSELNVSSAISIYSSDESILFISGRTYGDFKLKLLAEGHVTLTFVSKLDKSIKKQIEVYIVNSLSSFKLTDEGTASAIVNGGYKVEYTHDGNNNNFKLRLSFKDTDATCVKNFSVNDIFIEADKKVLSFTNVDPLYVKCSKAGTYTFTLAPYIVVNEQEVDLLTSTYSETITFYYGIKNYVSNLQEVSMAYNSQINYTLTATGDNMLCISNNVAYLPTLSFSNEDYLIITPVSANVYTEGKCIVAKFAKDSGLYKLTTDDNTELTDILANKTPITKVEYTFQINADITAITNYFKTQNNKDKTEIIISLMSTYSFTDNSLTGKDAQYKNATSAQVMTSFTLTKQMLERLGMEFYANCEKTIDDHGDTEFSVNEVPTNAIIASQVGMLKLNLYPINAQINSVVVYYNADSQYYMTLNQVIKYTNGSAARYYYSIPSAVADKDGRGLQLFIQRSNVTFDEQSGEPSYSYDGNLYVNFLIGSIVPQGTKFTITVEVSYGNNLTYVQSIVLVSQLKSEVQISYDFNGQPVTDFAYITYGLEKEFAVDYTKIFAAGVSVNEVSKAKVLVNNTKCKIAFKRIDFNDDNITKVVYTIIVSNDIPPEVENEDITIQIQITITSNNVQATFTSQLITLRPVNYVVTGISIVGNSVEQTDILTVKRSTKVNLQAKITIDDDSTGQFTSKFATDITALQKSIEYNLGYWFGRKTGSLANDYTTLITDENTYSNYAILHDADKEGIKYPIYIKVRNIAYTDKIYCKIKMQYTSLNGGKIDIATVDGETSLGSTSNMLIDDSGTHFQYLSDYITLNLVNDVGDENSIPVENQDDFYGMVSGSAEIGVINYALKCDLTLKNYIPRTLSYINFNGNQYNITIESFANTTDYADGKYGLFSNIDENSTAKNVNLIYDITPLESGTESVIDGTSLTELTEFDFGGIGAINYGIIYNCNVSSKYTFAFSNIIGGNVSTYIAGICAQNYGYITHTESSVAFTANCGTIAGFVAVNAKKISTSKVVLSGTISNTLTTKQESLTGGFVARNTGTIFGSYISGETLTGMRYTDATISSLSGVGGFVNTNSGTISNCYSNVNVTTTTRSSGFVFSNAGTIESSYSASTMIANNTAHTPFIGTKDSGSVNNSGTITDCYFLKGNFGTIANQLATQVDDGTKANFAEFVFAQYNNDGSLKDGEDGTWIVNSDKMPTLIDADLQYCYKRYCSGIKMSDDGITPTYNWDFVDCAEDGQKLDGKINPRTISSFATLNKYITDAASLSTVNDYFVLLCDIVCDSNALPNSSSIQFGGRLFGQNMTISNLYLRAQSDFSKDSFGLFSSISGTEENNAIVKDLKITPREVIANNVASVGTLAGYAFNSILTNIVIDAETVVVQGKYMVGGLVGFVADSFVTKITSSACVNASLTLTAEAMQNYNSTDWITDKALTSMTYLSKQCSYAGAFTGAMISVKNSTENSSIAGTQTNIEDKISTICSDIKITGESKVIGIYAGTCVGFIDFNTKLVYSNVAASETQYIRAYNFAGGLVGENRGVIDRCFVQNESSATRNTSYFAGSPKMIGGLVGFNNGGTITNSYSKLDVLTQNTKTYSVGGLVGLDVGGTIQYCYATGAVVSKFIVGGLIGSVSNYQTLIGKTVKGESDTNNNILFDHEGDTCAYINYYVADVVSAKDGSIIKKNKSKFLIKNCVAANEYISSTITELGATNADLIATSTSHGLFIGAVVINGTDGDVVNGLDYIASVFDEDAMFTDGNFNSLNNFVSSQITLKTIYKDGTYMYGSTEVAVPDIIKSFGAETVNTITDVTIGLYASDFTGIQSENASGKKKNIAACSVNSALISTYSLRNFDDLIINYNGVKYGSEVNGIYLGFNDAFTLPSKAVSSTNYYPTLKFNINA